MSPTSITILVLLRLILLLNTSHHAASYSFFRDRIPNGHNVPNPCDDSTIWWGVGHEDPNGGGSRNPFGLDFQQLGMQWGRCLCELDSDGDGRTNGEELGDPNCVFVEGGTANRTTGITHPGVCEPLDANTCKGKNAFLNCQEKSFSCPEFNNASTKTINLTLSRTHVPPVVTTYICQIFDLPRDGDYWMIGFTPIIDNVDILHHIILYGCTDDITPSLRPNFTDPNSNCGMIPNVCPEIIGVWSVGLPGQCLGDNYGFRIGQSGVKAAIMEIHWNNPQMTSTYTDASGLELYYTPNKPLNDAATFLIGSITLIIPPQQNGLEQYGLCPANCTNYMLQNSTIYIPAILPHMHSLGRGMTVSIKKKESHAFQVVLDVQNYNYDSPKIVEFDPPLELSPGDEVNVSCIFFSVNKNSYTFFGPQTSDEMCFAIVTYYPYLPTINWCFVGGILAGCGDVVFNQEKVIYCFKQSRLWTDIAAVVGAEIYQNCDVKSGLNCSAGCRTLVDRLKAIYPECLNDDIRSVVLYTVYTTTTDENTRAVARGLLSCEPKPGLGAINNGGSGVNTQCYPSPSAAAPTTSPRLRLYQLFFTLVTVGIRLFNPSLRQ